MEGGFRTFPFNHRLYPYAVMLPWLLEKFKALAVAFPLHYSYPFDDDAGGKG